MSKFYAVKEGRVPGVYTTWAECEEQIKGYSGADYKKFNNEEDAKLFAYGAITTASETLKNSNGFEPNVLYLKQNTLDEIRNCLMGVLTATKQQDKFEILKNVQDICMLMNIEIDGINNPVLFMD